MDDDHLDDDHPAVHESPVAHENDVDHDIVGRIGTPDGIIEGRLRIERDRITSLHPGPVPAGAPCRRGCAGRWSRLALL